MRTRAVLTVLGEDRVGIVAAVTRALAESAVNIEDIRQTIIDGVMTMTMVVTVDEQACSFDRVKEALAKVAERIGVQITLQREDALRAGSDA